MEKGINPYKTGDRVQCKAKSRKHGTVIRNYCGNCAKCTSTPRPSTYECTASEKDKVRVLAEFHNGYSFKRYKYDYTELEPNEEENLPFKPTTISYDFSPKEIQPLGDIEIDIPLIVPEEYQEVEEEEEELSEDDVIEVQEDPANLKRPERGSFWDKHISDRISRPI